MPLSDALLQQLPRFPPFVQWYLQSHADDATSETFNTAADWVQSITKPDTVAKTGFGLKLSTTTKDILLGRANGQGGMDTLRGQLADGVFDDETNDFRISDEELSELTQGVLRCRAKWQVNLEQYPSIAKGVLHTTLQATFESPYIPEFNVTVTINDADAGDPTRFMCTGVLGPGLPVSRLQAAFNAEDGILTLTGDDGSLVNTFRQDDDSSAYLEMLRRGRIVDVKGRVSTLVGSGRLHRRVLSLPDEDQLSVANYVMLRDMAKTQADALGDMVKQLLDAGTEIDSHHERLKLEQAMDVLNLADVRAPKQLPPDTADELGEIAKALVANRESSGPRSGGARAAWLAKMGWINADEYDSMPRSKKLGFLDDEQRDYYCWKLLQMRNGQHRDHHNHDRWRELNTKIEALTHLMEEPIATRVLAEEADKSIKTQPLPKLQETAELEEGMTPSPATYKDDYAELDALLKAHPSKVPLTLRDNDDEDDTEQIDAVDPADALEQQMAVATHTKSARKAAVSVAREAAKIAVKAMKETVKTYVHQEYIKEQQKRKK